MICRKCYSGYMLVVDNFKRPDLRKCPCCGAYAKEEKLYRAAGAVLRVLPVVPELKKRDFESDSDLG